MGKSRKAKARAQNWKNEKSNEVFLKPQNQPQKQKQKQKQKLRKQQKQNPIQDEDPFLFGGGPSSSPSDDGDGAANPGRIHALLEPYTKDQLISFLVDAVAEDPGFLYRVRVAAETDVAHRKVFVHGLGWDATRDTLLEAFEPFGPVEDCNVVIDKATGRSKGYGFVLFRTRSAAVRALKEPQKKIKNRLTSCQLASLGGPPGGGGAAASGGAHGDTAGRKLYVSNVPADAQADKLRAMFAQFGELESGPFGFDMATGKSRGFALFVYKTQEGAKKALAEPHKMFQGRQLHCQMATDSSQKGKAASAAAAAPASAVAPAAAPTVLGHPSQTALAAAAAAQNLALYSQNPAYAALLGQNPFLAAAVYNPAALVGLNPAAVAAVNPAAGLAAGAQGHAIGGVGGAVAGGGAPSVLGSYGSQGAAASFPYQGSRLGQSSSARPSRSFGPSYIW
ncbi:UBP1-associated protein 2B [Ananas comosus]|uniref:UBP1-associated protein 2B n=1 Tax=Ananas comosus TaxID=4615 RepID=A0A199VNG9_ANACO|nr:UBP1-associated protein 2B [Ananas comosus]